MRRTMAAALCLLALASGPREKKYVALTFDDGPSGRYTRQLLDGLYDRGVKGTFLLCGYRIQQDPDLARRIYQEGHEIGLHGYSHRNMQTMGRRDLAAEIDDTRALLPEGCGCAFLRPPGGVSSDAVRQVAKAKGLAILSWSVDPKDWAVHDAATVERRVLEHVKDGDVILLHDMTTSSVKAALDIVDVLLKEDYEIVTVSELAKLRQVRLNPGETYCSFPQKEENP